MSNLPPHNLEAERAVLGALLLEPESLPRAVGILRPPDFYKDGHRIIFAAVLALFGRNEPVDLLTLAEELRRQGMLEQAGGAAALAALVEEAAIAAHVLNYVKIVREYAQKRSLVQLGAKMIADAQNGAAPHVVIAAGIDGLERLSQTADANASPWKAARSASDFLKADDPEVPWLVGRILARGAITEVYSPRGLGKTNVALALAVDLSRRGLRVLYLDRDNPPRELRRRLRAWGGADLANLKVMLRHEVPPLKDAGAWAVFPIADHDVITIDALDATAEGIGEQDSAKPSRAIAPLLDLARRENGPAIMVLGNTIKSGAHARGSGVIEDRADISFEVRDATGLRPTGKKPWWEELADAGVGAWAERATRRRRRDTLRLAFVASKFRLGEEPEPSALEIDFTSTPWRLREVTADLNQAASAATAAAEQEHRERVEKAVAALKQAIAETADGEPVLKGRAEELLHAHGVPRREARDLIEQRAGQEWRLVPLPGRGNPIALLPVEAQSWGNGGGGGNTGSLKSPGQTRPQEGLISADRMDTVPRKSDAQNPAPDEAIREGGLFSPPSAPGWVGESGDPTIDEPGADDAPEGAGSSPAPDPARLDRLPSLDAKALA